MSVIRNTEKTVRLVLMQRRIAFTRNMHHYFLFYFILFICLFIIFFPLARSFVGHTSAFFVLVLVLCSCPNYSHKELETRFPKGVVSVNIRGLHSSINNFFFRVKEMNGSEEK